MAEAEASRAVAIAEAEKMKKVAEALKNYQVIDRYLKVEGFFRTRRFSHEFPKLVLQLGFRWGDACT